VRNKFCYKLDIYRVITSSVDAFIDNDKHRIK